MASFIDRCRFANDWDTDGGEVEFSLFLMVLTLYSQGIVNASEVKTYFGCTTAQGIQLQDILDTMPTVILTLVNARNRAEWPGKVCFICRGGGSYGGAAVNLGTDQEVKDALGI